MIKLPQNKKGEIKRWLALSPEHRRHFCPFTGTRSENCINLCYKIFPTFKEKQKESPASGIFRPCPCGVFTLKYVERVAKQIVQEVTTWN